MRRITHHINVSLDGRICGPNGEFDWTTMGPEHSAYSRAIQPAGSSLLYGRVVWGWMSSYWPHADEVSTDPHDRAYAPLWRATPKVVASRTLDTVDAENTVLVRSVDEIAALEGDFVLMGGGELAGALTAACLVDRLSIIVHPVVLGGDHALLPGAGRSAFTLRESRVLDGSAVLSMYDRA
ncbi:dihydrofolate reductase family protein [Pseudonocardia xishanensis]|uniref:Dihydrofolate reductase family protein n=1 Tax=Pseudonocardia xishanensis TaxID=630995 RepID=A0ABP8S1G5_9PSEU